MTLSKDSGRRMKPMYARLPSLSVRAAVGAGLAGVVADLAGVRSLLVTVLVLVFLAVAPAAAIAGLMRGFDLFARLVIACATAVAVITLIAMIMLALGAWSPKGGLVAIALVSGACVLVPHAGPLRSRIAERADRLRQAMIDYCVVVGGERTADWATGRAEAKRDRAGDATAQQNDAVAQQDDAVAQQNEVEDLSPTYDKTGDTAAKRDEADGTPAGPDTATSQLDGQLTVPAERAPEAANGNPPATDVPAGEPVAEPEVVAADSAGGDPPRFRDTA